MEGEQEEVEEEVWEEGSRAGRAGPVDPSFTEAKASVKDFSPLHGGCFSAQSLELVQKQVASLWGFSPYIGERHEVPFL